MDTETPNEDVFKQGTNYVEKTTDNEEVKEESSLGDSSLKTGGSIFKNPYIIISIGTAIVVLIVILVIFTSSGSKESDTTDVISSEEFESQYEEYEFYYTDDEREQLRIAGYTGYEIEEFEQEMIDAQEKISEAETLRKQQYDIEIGEYLDGASDKFLELQDMTWVGQNELEVDGNSENYEYRETTVNVDYEKIPATGYQCFIKAYIHPDKAVFFYIEPDRYAELADEGNILLNIKFTVMGNGENVITSVEEIIP